MTRIFLKFVSFVHPATSLQCPPTRCALHTAFFSTDTLTIERQHDHPDAIVDAAREKLERLSFGSRRFVKSESRAQLISSVLEKVRFLHEQQFPPAEIGRMLSKPSVVSRLARTSIAQLDLFVLYFRSLGFGEEIVARIIQQCPQGSSLDVWAQCKPTIEFWQTMSLTGSELESFVAKRPAVLWRKLDNVRNHVTFLESIPLDKQTVCRIIKRYPQVFNSSIEQTLMPRIEALMRMGLTGDRLAKTLVVRPAILEFSTTSLTQKLDYLVELGIEPRSNYFYRAVAALTSTRIEQLQERFNNLLSLGFSDDDARIAVKRLPSLLYLKEESIRSKMDFLVKEMNLPLAEIAKNPVILGFSFENRIKPRFESYLRWKKQNPENVRRISFTKLLSVSNLKFSRRFGACNTVSPSVV